jgi:cyanosortase A-associated protein
MTQLSNRITNRQILLGITVVGLLLAVLKLALDPKAANRQPPNFSFPQSVEIPGLKLLGWQFLSSKAIAPENPKLEEFFLDIHEYQFNQDQKSSQKALTIGMYYTLGTRGESSEFLAKRFKIETATIPIKQEIKGNAETGYYSLFNYKGRSHLVSCINPRGTSTVTSQQFFRNRNAYDFQSDRIIPWFFGQVSLRDLRCIWVDMSIPEAAKSASILEKAWEPWYQYWQGKFPASFLPQ